MKASVIMTPTHALIYAKIKNKNEMTHFTTDAHFDLYLKIRTEVPKIVVLFNSRRDLVKRLAQMNYFV